MDEGGGGDRADQFHHNEAISAVVDDGILAEEEDDDYEDLYNDVNVGEGFLQSLRKNEDLGFKNDEEKPIESPAVAPNFRASIPGVGSGSGEGNGGVGGGVDNGSRGSVRPAEGYNQSQVSRGNEIGTRGAIGSRPAGDGEGGIRVKLAGDGEGGIRVKLDQGSKLSEMEEQSSDNVTGVQMTRQRQQQQQQPQQIRPQSHGVMVGNENSVRQSGGGNVPLSGVAGNGIGSVGITGGGGTILFVGDLHWWTTDAELEVELCKYGAVKEVKFFDEKASGKSKGYCQVEFYDPGAATVCKEGMNGHMFNGRPCVVANASPYSVKRMGEAQLNKTQQMSQTANSQARRGPNDAGVKPGGSNIMMGGNYQGGDSSNNNNRSFGRGNWGRGNAQGMGNRGPMGPMRHRGSGMGGRGIMGNGFGQSIGTTPSLMHPQSMMSQGFDPVFGGPMGRMGGYGGFPGAPVPPFAGILSSFPPVGGVGLPGVAPHVNPAFFGRGMPMNGMGMMTPSGVDGPNMGMWSDPGMGGGWGGEEHGGGRAGESSYGEEAASDLQYGEASHDRGGWPNAMKEKDRGSERDWSASSDRRYRDDRDPVYDRDMPRGKDMVSDHEWSERKHHDVRDVGQEREREREQNRERSHDRDRDRDCDRDREKYKKDRERYADHHMHEDHWEKGQSSRSHSKLRVSHEDDHRSRSRDADYGKRKRLTSE